MTQYSYKILPLFKAEIKNSELVVPDAEKSRMRKWSMSQNDGEVEIRLGKKKRKRSNKQNAAFWVLPVQLIYEGTHGQWESEDDVYHFIEDKFSKKKAIKIGNELRWVTRKLKTLNSTEFGEVYQAVQRWSAEALNLQINDPDPEYLAHELKMENDKSNY